MTRLDFSWFLENSNDNLQRRREPMNLAIAITLSRFVFAPIACGLYYARLYPMAAIVIAVGALTDWIDGVVARKTGRVTELGARLDPLADKWFALLAFVTLSLRGDIPWWISAVVIGRDGMIVVGVMIVMHYNRRLRFEPVSLSKWTTALQSLALIATFARSYCIDAQAACELTPVMVIQTLALHGMVWFLVISGLNYGWVGWTLLCKRSRS